jgi:ribosomal protein S18 acetylase RimI-like enzyme
MSLLAVRPKYQRRGLGSMLLAPVLELADGEKGEDIYPGECGRAGVVPEIWMETSG